MRIRSATTRPQSQFTLSVSLIQLLTRRKEAYMFSSCVLKLRAMVNLAPGKPRERDRCRLNGKGVPYYWMAARFVTSSSSFNLPECVSWKLQRNQN